MKWKTPYIDLPQQFKNLEEEITSEFKRVMSEGSFILRGDVDKFEKNMASYLDCKHVIGVNSGTDALYLATEVLGIGEGDEVITVAHTFVATLASIALKGAVPVLVDIREDYNMNPEEVKKNITAKTKAIIPVNLNGRSCEMDKLIEIAENNNLFIIEDSAQSLGAKYKGKQSGTFGLIGCFSTHPMKTLNSPGDGGFIATDNDEIAGKLRLLRNHGEITKEELACYGYNSRLDNLQAAILNVKMKHLDEWIARRREIASVYSGKLSNLPIILPPKPSQENYFDTYNSYVIRTDKQKELFSYLREKGIEVFTHISQPLYKFKELNLPDYNLPVNEKICKEIISLPVYPEMNNEQVDYVVETMRDFFRKK